MIDEESIEMEPIRAVAIAEPQALAVVEKPSVDALVERAELVQEAMARVLREGEHYGVIPGTGSKPTLLKSGAEKLSLLFRLRPKFTITCRNLDGGHREYEVLCDLYAADGTHEGQGLGLCSSMESKYRWRSGKAVCPECGEEAIIKGKKEYGGGWICFKKQGGCGAKFTDADAAITSQVTGKVENPDPADCYNTVLKMAKKRAHVDATLTATAASDMFTQDVEDMPARGAPPPAAARRQGRAAQETPPPERGAPPDTKQREKFLQYFNDLVAEHGQQKVDAAAAACRFTDVQHVSEIQNLETARAAVRRINDTLSADAEAAADEPYEPDAPEPEPTAEDVYSKWTKTELLQALDAFEIMGEQDEISTYRGAVDIPVDTKLALLTKKMLARYADHIKLDPAKSQAKGGGEPEPLGTLLDGATS